MARIVINNDWCKSCGICVDFCPTDILEIDISGKLKVKNEDDCISCKLCEMRCPDLAIEIEEGEE